MDKASLSHTKWNCMYHIVFIPKYRRRVMYGKLREDIREIIRKLCKYKGVEIVEGSVSVDHIHLCVKIPPKISVSTFMGYLKGKSALMISINIQSTNGKETDTFGQKDIMSILWVEMKK